MRSRNTRSALAGFGALPTADPEVAAREFERCIKELGLKGAMIHGHTQGVFFGEKRFWGIFETALTLGVTIYLHPTMPHPGAIKTYFEGYEELQGSAWGFAIDTETHFVRIMFAGVFDANILFAVDWLYESNTSAIDFLQRLPISDQDKEKIEYSNAHRILRI